jgi:hypothetical protein
MPVLKVEEFLQKMEAVYKSKNLSKEEIKYNLEIIKQNWKRIAEDGRDLHKLILRAKPNSTYTEIDELTKGTSFEHLGDVIRDTVYDDIFKQIKLRNGIESKEMGDTSSPKIIKNINISAKLLGRDETITGHIDYIVVKPDGTLEIFNIKSSHESPEFWDRAKKEKYMNEFALLARILQYNGINVKNIRFNVIPVVLKYDD